MCGSGSGYRSHRLRNDSRLSNRLRGRLGQRLSNWCRLPSCCRQLRGTATRTARSEQFTLGDRPSSNLLSSRGRFGHRAGRFTSTGVDGAALIAVDSASCRVLDSLDVRQLAGLLVIFNAVSLLVSVEINGEESRPTFRQP